MAYNDNRQPYEGRQSQRDRRGQHGNPNIPCQRKTSGASPTSTMRFWLKTGSTGAGNSFLVHGRRDQGLNCRDSIIRPPGFDTSKKYPVKFLISWGGRRGLGEDAWSYRWNAELFAGEWVNVVVDDPIRAGRRVYGQAIYRMALTETGAGSLSSEPDCRGSTTRKTALSVYR